MSWDYIPGRNDEGYPDPTAATALAHAQRSQRGAMSRRAGEHFEAMVSASCGWYADHGLAKIQKTPEPMKPLRKPNQRGQFLACFTKQAQPDYGGTLRGGRSVYFEAKHTEADKIEASRLTLEQVEDLEAHHKLGALTFVIVSFGLEKFYRIPWETWRDMKKLYGRKHLKQAELEPFRIKYVAGVLKLLDGLISEEAEQGKE